MSKISKIQLTNSNGVQTSYDLSDSRLDGYTLANFALKSDLVGVYKYKGSLSSILALDNVEDKTVGDVYNITTTDMNYAWTGSDWDPLGGTITIESITNNEIDTLMST